MTSNTYIMDSSSLIELHRHNPMDVYPSVWKNLEFLIKKRLLMAPKEVLNEIRERDDHLSRWAKDHQDMFRDPSEEQVKNLQDILKRYPAMVKERGKYDADPWIIALALETAAGAQRTLVPMTMVVVTEEKIRGKKIKIPFVCKKYNIKTVDIIEMFRIEGWKF